MPDRTRARELAAEFNQKGDPTGWFESLYREAAEGQSIVPWADLCPNRHLLDFLKSHPIAAAGKSALVIGSGLGDDADHLASLGFRVTAFDISETAIRSAAKRFPNGPRPHGGSIEHLTANLLAAPAGWSQCFDFVLEIYTLQALPPAPRATAIGQIANSLRPGGQLLLIAAGRELSDPPGQLPWPLTREELSAFKAHGLFELSFEDFSDAADPDVRRFRVLYKRPR
jgi:SAM-dependent methyltransferase